MNKTGIIQHAINTRFTVLRQDYYEIIHTFLTGNNKYTNTHKINKTTVRNTCADIAIILDIFVQYAQMNFDKDETVRFRITYDNIIKMAILPMRRQNVSTAIEVLKEMDFLEVITGDANNANKYTVKYKEINKAIEFMFGKEVKEIEDKIEYTESMQNCQDYFCKETGLEAGKDKTKWQDIIKIWVEEYKVTRKMINVALKEQAKGGKDGKTYALFSPKSLHSFVRGALRNPKAQYEGIASYIIMDEDEKEKREKEEAYLCEPF